MNYPSYRTYTPRVYRYLESRSKKPIYNQINEYLDYCYEIRQMSQMTMRSKISAYRSFVVESKCDNLENLTNEDYDRFVKKELERDVSNRTINTKTAHVMALIRYWREMGMNIPLKAPLVVKLKERPPRRACYTRDEVSEVLNNCNSEMQWLLIKIAFDTGMRINELKSLRVNQISGRRIDFVGKGSKQREVYLTQETCHRLSEYIIKNNIQDHVWLNDWGYPLCVDSIRRLMREAFTKCNHPDFYPHALRHSFGSDIYNQGADILEIKEMMGHESIKTTQKYLHSLDGKMCSLFDKYKG